MSATGRGKRLGGPEDGTDIRSLPGFLGYWAGGDGHIYSTKPWRGSMSMRRLFTSPTRDGYPRVQLYMAGKVRHVCVHTLVAAVFLPPRPEGQEVRHIDGDPGNSLPTNLTWGTHQENIDDRAKHGTTARGERAGMAKLTEELVIEIRGSKESAPIVAERMGVSRSLIGAVRQRLIWRHVP